MFTQKFKDQCQLEIFLLLWFENGQVPILVSVLARRHSPRNDIHHVQNEGPNFDPWIPKHI